MEGAVAVQVLHSTPLHTSLEMFYPAKADSRQQAVGYDKQESQNKTLPDRLVARNYYLLQLTGSAHCALSAPKLRSYYFL